MEQETNIQSDSKNIVESYFLRQKFLLISVWGFVLGIFISSFTFISPLIAVFLVVIACGIYLLEKIWHSEVGKEPLFIFLALISLSLGILRYNIKDFHEPVVPSSTGIVISEPELRENSTRFVMQGDNGEKVLISTDLYGSVGYGDRIEFEGILKEPGIIDDGVGRPFDYAKYLSKDDIYHTASFANVKVLSSGHGSSIKHALFNIKNSLINKMREILPEPESSLLAGLVVAGKASMPQSVLEEFRRAGIIHIVVLSGYNITIIAIFLKNIFENIFLRVRLPKKIPLIFAPRLALLASVLGIIFFVLMTGAEATVVRAAIMVFVVIFANLFGKTFSPSRALLGAGALMVMHNPKILVFDPSFQLSFIATCALVYITPIFDKWLGKLTDIWSLRTTISATVSTQIAVLPFLVYSMGEISLVSLPSNLLVLLVIPLTMFLGFLSAVIAYVSFVVALPFAFISHLLLTWILSVSHYLGNMKISAVSVPEIPFFVVVVVYVGLITFVWRYSKSLQGPSS